MMLLLATLLMVGCKKDKNSSTGNQNPNPAKDTPLSENLFSEFETIYQLYPKPDGSFYALAYGEYTDYLVSLDNNGYVQQRLELGYRSNRCINTIGNNVVLIGNSGYYATPYEMYEKGKITLYDGNFQRVAMAIVEEPQHRVELRTLVKDSQDPFVFYAGGLAIDSAYIQYPYLCTLHFSDGRITKLSSRIFSDYPKCRIGGMIEKNNAGQKDLVLETVTYLNDEDPYESSNCVVHITKLNYFEETSGWGCNTWDVAIIGPQGNSFSTANSLDSDENNVYFLGYCDDDKTPSPSNGGYWDSGMVAAVNWRQGKEAWTKVVSLTNKAERFYAGQLSEGYLYACGMHGGLYYGSTTKKAFSNGLVAKITLSGELVGYKTFGESDRDSYLYHLVKDAKGNWVCAGSSGENLEESIIRWQGWFMKTDNTFENSSKEASAAKDESYEELEVGSTMDVVF